MTRNDRFVELLHNAILSMVERPGDLWSLRAARLDTMASTDLDNLADLVGECIDVTGYPCEVCEATIVEGDPSTVEMVCVECRGRIEEDNAYHERTHGIGRC